MFGKRRALDILTCILAFAISVAVTIFAVPKVKELAVKVDAIDYPSGRRVNTEPIPRLGGVAMFIGMSVALMVIVVLVWARVLPPVLQPHPFLRVNYAVTAIGVALMFVVGVIDDVYNLSPKSKLAGQVVASAVVVSSGVVLSVIHNPFTGGYFDLGLAGYPITVVYLVCFANVINLIDGLDGLAAGITAISASTLLVFSFLTGRPDSALFSCVLIGACLGFLKYNHHPASIFMGDSGSLLLGFLLGVVSLFAVARAAAVTSLLIPIVAAGVPIIDTAAAIIRRKRGHEPVGKADKGHIHHRLLENHGHAETVHLMWGWTALLSLGSILLPQLEWGYRVLLLVVLAGISAVIVMKLHLLEPALRHKGEPRFSRRHVKDGTFDEFGNLIGKDDGPQDPDEEEPADDAAGTEGDEADRADG